MPSDSGKGYQFYVGLKLLALAVIIATAILSYRAISNLEQAIQGVADSHTVFDTVTRVDALLGESEALFLRYVVSEREDYLNQYREKVTEIGAALAKLKLLVAASPKQRIRLEAVIAAHHDRAAYNGEIITMKAYAPRDYFIPIARRIREGGSQYLSDVTKKNLRDMAFEESRLLAQKVANRQAMIAHTRRTLITASGLALIAGLVGLFALDKSQRESSLALRAELDALRANRASREKSLFLASMSHEIRTPMNAILGFARLLSDTPQGDVEKSYIDAIKKSGEALLDLINDVLDLSKVEAGKFELKPQPTDLKEIAEQAIELFSQAAHDQGIRLRLEFRTKMPSLIIDPLRLRQILINIVGNAVKYTERGEVLVMVECRRSSARDLRDLRISVQDSGTGMSAEQCSNIFEPFYQAESPDGKVRQGTGLGLSITKRLLETMHGTIRVDSVIGRGSTFTAEIPELEVAEPPPIVLDGSDQADFGRLPPLRLLVVDDVAWNRDLVRAYLRDAPLEVREASDGIEAVEAAKKFLPQVVLMDIRMPRMGGVEAKNRIKADSMLASTKVIAVTASSLTGDESELRESFDGYVRKPYTARELYREIVAHFGERKIEIETAAIPLSAPVVGTSFSEAPLLEPLAAVERLAQIRSEVLPGLKISMRMREIEKIAIELQALALGSGRSAVAEYAQDLLAAVRKFDVAGVKQLLARYPSEP